MTEGTKVTKPREVWLSGTERIHMVQELLGLEHENDPQVRGIGRTTRLAVKYVSLGLKCPDHKVMIKDHFQNQGQSDRHLLKKCTDILDALNVDYQVGEEENFLTHRKDLWFRVQPIRKKV